MTPEQEKIVADARAAGVALFRTGKPGWDAPDHRASPWYVPEEWDDEGNYYGPHRPMFPEPIQQSESIQPEQTDSPTTDSDNRAITLLKDGSSIRDVAEATGLSIGKVQRIKAKLST